MMAARRIDSEVGFDVLVDQMAASKSKFLLISLSLVEQQRYAVEAIIERVLAWPKHYTVTNPGWRIRCKGRSVAINDRGRFVSGYPNNRLCLAW
jgi:hypothetical protein